MDLAFELKDALGERDRAIKATFDKMSTKVDALEKLQERVEEIEARRSSPGKTRDEKAAREHVERFTNWLRKSTDPRREAELRDFEDKEFKDVTIGTSAAGGFAVPEEISRQIEALQKKLSPVRDLVKVVKSGTSDYKELLNIRGASSGWVGETGTRTATTTPSLREVTPTHGELYAYPQASEWSLDDIFFNVENWLSENVAYEFSVLEGDAVIRGNGTSRPTGMLNTAPTNQADAFPPVRAAAAYQYIPSGTSAVITPDSLITLTFAVNSEYRANAHWAMNSATLGVIRKLKATTNEYLYQPGLVAGQPDLLLGYPVPCGNRWMMSPRTRTRSRSETSAAPMCW
jgi:HK97 family phage major capsid protein